MFRDQLTVWPGHPKPKEGELLSSWITRLARANHMATADFCRVVLPDKSATLKEIDRTYNAEMMQALADGTGVPIERVWEMSLLSEEGYVFNRRSYGTTEWILPTAAVDGVDGNGMVYCPQCLSSDDEPYYRKSWRFTFNPVCPTHRAFLRRGCPSCGKPYNYFYATSAQPSMATPIATCRWCGADVCHAPAAQDNSALIKRALAIQEEINSGIARDSFTVFGHDYIHAQPYLRFFHACMNSLTVPDKARWVARNHPEALPKGINVAVLDRNDYTFVIEQRSPEELGILLCLADVLMEGWPDRFMHYVRKLKISPHKFFSSKTIPHWVTQSASEFWFAKADGFSNGEIENARQILRKRLGRPESEGELKVFMTLGKVRNLDKVSPKKRKEAELASANFELKHSGPGEDFPRKKSDKWRKLIAVESADQLAKIAILRMPAQIAADEPATQLELFDKK